MKMKKKIVRSCSGGENFSFSGMEKINVENETEIDRDI